jgi:hypothetical protein
MEQPPKKWPTWVIVAITLVVAVAVVVSVVLVLLFSSLFGGSGY